MACGCCHFFQDTTQKQFSFGVLLSSLNLKVLKDTTRKQFSFLVLLSALNLKVSKQS